MRGLWLALLLPLIGGCATGVPGYCYADRWRGCEEPLRRAKAGDVTAMMQVGLSYEIARKNRAAMAWYRRAADAGHHRAISPYARLLGHDRPAEALAWLERGAAAGDRDSRFSLAMTLAQGPDPALHDAPRARAILDALVAEGDTAATLDYARWQARLPEGKAKARELYEKLSAQEGSFGMYPPLARMLVAGEGGPADPVRGRAMLEAYVAQVPIDTPVVEDLIVLLEKGIGGPADPERAAGFRKYIDENTPTLEEIL
ncbi:hypothetical protein GVN21_13635 [Caulobacter sp. SLTY]|uniref:tetratricopeptide repeat protein n=1 Tax=Caulobacter sp. SLTY TaxID=2683262 RepID=UPI001412286B|nr:sel1 repeat family protein [Caulobacter sp. SLTY]NBB16402.1 hypothetical protein [Caulobacter sp. SLTY]